MTLPIVFAVLLFLIQTLNAISIQKSLPDLEASGLTCSTPLTRRIDCGYLGIDQNQCEQQNGCCWAPTDAPNTPWCFHKSAESCSGYKVVSVANTENRLVALLKLKEECLAYGEDVKYLNLIVEYQAQQRLRVAIMDADKSRYEVSEKMLPRQKLNEKWNDTESRDFEFRLIEDPFSFQVIRKSDNEIIFDTSPSSSNSQSHVLIFEENYMELTTAVPKEANIYGLGEVVRAFRRDPNYTRQTMWSRDATTPKDQNVYGVHPFHMEYRKGRAHGVFLLNSNGMDVILKSEAITYKVIGGILDFYFFAGPTPAQVVQQYHAVIGHPFMPAYWVLGFHQCRYGYRDIWEVESVVAKFAENQIPLETMWTDIDYMDSYRDFTFHPFNYPVDKVKSFVQDLHARHQHYVLIVDPAIKVEDNYMPYVTGMSKGLFIRQADGSVFHGKVWPGISVFPDFLNPDTQEWWSLHIGDFMDSVDLDGLWIDMNEPASFCDGSCERSLTSSKNSSASTTFSVYKINNAGYEAPLDLKTVSPDALHRNGDIEYDVHNLYGHSESIATWNAVRARRPNQRPFILSRSTFAGSGKYVGHWSGDNWSTWEYLYLSIPSLFNFQLFGIPLTGSDICGFVGDTTEELCARWMQLGAFYPFSRNHAAIGTRYQEPYLWNSVADASRNALRVRYQLLPHFYTLFYLSHKHALTVIRPLFFEFPEDEQTANFDREFMVGAGVLVVPVLEQGKSDVSAYLPLGVWFDWYSHEIVAEVTGTTGVWKTLPAPLNHIPVLIRGGHIISTQIPAMTTFASRLNDFELVVALNGSGEAFGDLYLDDGETFELSSATSSFIHFQAAGKVLKSFGRFNYSSSPSIGSIFILRVLEGPTLVNVNGNVLSDENWHFDANLKQLALTALSLSTTAPFSLSWA